MRRIPSDVLARPVEGLNLRPAADGGPATFGGQVQGGATLVALLRHLG